MFLKIFFILSIFIVLKYPACRSLQLSKEFIRAVCASAPRTFGYCAWCERGEWLSIESSLIVRAIENFAKLYHLLHEPAKCFRGINPRISLRFEALREHSKIHSYFTRVQRSIFASRSLKTFLQRKCVLVVPNWSVERSHGSQRGSAKRRWVTVLVSSELSLLGSLLEIPNPLLPLLKASRKWHKPRTVK